MNNHTNGKVHYLCFYAEPEVEGKIITYSSALSKIDYVVDAVKGHNKEVIVVSVAPSKQGRFPGFQKKVDALESHIYLPSRMTGNKILNKWYFIRQNITVLRYLLKNVKANDRVIVYHSLHNRLWMKIYSSIAPNKLVLQIEDVFSALSEDGKRFAKQEKKLFRKMKKCLCVNDLIYNELSVVPQKLVSYGSYNLPPEYETQMQSGIHLVYAGVIEQERKAAFVAVQAMQHLPEQYKLHILGFGTEENIQELNRQILKVNEALGREAVCFHGKMSGEEYWRFLQGCNIALSTHVYDATNQAAADNTFPSKVLTYMANGLPVVAQRLQVLEESKIADNLWFYDQPDPASIAAAIQSVDIKSAQDLRNSIAALDREFRDNMKKLLES